MNDFSIFLVGFRELLLENFCQRLIKIEFDVMLIFLISQAHQLPRRVLDLWTHWARHNSPNREAVKDCRPIQFRRRWVKITERRGSRQCLRQGVCYVHWLICKCQTVIRMHMLYVVYFVRGGFRTKIKCMRKCTKEFRESAAVSDLCNQKISCVRKVGERRIRKLSAVRRYCCHTVLRCFVQM